MLIIVIMICVVMMIASLYAIIWPKKVWYYAEGWKFNNVEPSDLALRMPRVGGVMGLIIGTVFLIWAAVDLLSR